MEFKRAMTRLINGKKNITTDTGDAPEYTGYSIVQV